MSEMTAASDDGGLRQELLGQAKNQAPGKYAINDERVSLAEYDAAMRDRDLVDEQLAKRPAAPMIQKQRHAHLAEVDAWLTHKMTNRLVEGLE